MTLFPLLEMLELEELPKLRHFFLTKRVTEFPFLREVRIRDCPEMQTFVQHGISVSTPSLESVNNDDEVKVVDDLNKAMFNSKVSCPSLEFLCINKANSINSLYSHQHPTAYFSKLEKLELWHCGKLRNLMSPSVARSLLNLRILAIYDCQSMEEVITKEEQQGERIMTLFPRLEDLSLDNLPKLGHFFPTEHALKFPFLREVWIDDCPKMKTFVQQGISVNTPSLENVNNDDEVKVVDLNKAMFHSKLPKLGHFFLTEHALKFPFLIRVWIDDCPEMKTFVQQGISVSTPSLECLNDDYEVKVDDLNKWTTEEQKASQGTTNGDKSEAIVGDKSEASDDYERVKRDFGLMVVGMIDI
ncbi:hypothetical protein MTR67_051012 [Solanum verrucosum]|uniref:Disease resistance protein At4g27190-like leucine-rich repeats domain-containing protein n=1 Tax=Solanum verrucosum TaxID=315347 RepID=A0AAF0V424_SOLVR|nr:hypothetical protein MTR67_051012 [Solanum verrucosum]